MIKRLFDIIISLIALLFLFPVLVLIFLQVRIKFGSPVFFIQERSGLCGRPFQMIKFRTMTDEKNDRGESLPDSVRLTTFGAFLRSSSLDELPELWNVLRGEMSLIGPRPLLMEYLTLYTPEQSRRHEVRPGITGWAQVNGRNTISWEEKFSLDVWYVDNRSFWLDMKVLVLTVKNIINRHGINADGETTMQRFEGSKGQ